MRLRWKRRIAKQLRRMRKYERTLAVRTAKLERKGLPLVEALRVVMLDPAEFHLGRGSMGKLLSITEMIKLFRLC